MTIGAKCAAAFGYFNISMREHENVQIHKAASPALCPKNNAGLLVSCRPSWWHENPKPDQTKTITAGIGCRRPADTGGE